MTDHKRFTLATPTFDEQSTINRCLHVLQDLRDHAEIIVVDRGSTDALACRALADPVRTAPPGRARQMNFGAQCPKTLS